MTLVNYEEPICGEVVEQRPRARSGLTTREVARIILNARAVADLAHHLQVKGGALPQPCRLEDLPRGLKFTAA